MASKISNDVNVEMTTKIKTRFKNFVKSCGGAALMSKDSIFSYGYIRATIGSRTRLPSPRMVLILTARYRDDVSKRYTKEYLRPDLLPAQWRVLEAELKAESNA